MNAALWVVAGTLAAAFLTGGAMKLLMPKERLATAGMAFVEDLGRGTVRTIGALEVLAATGLVLPALLGVAPVLVAWAAIGLVLLMAGAAVTHLRRHERAPVVANLVIAGLALFVAWGRLGPEAFTS